MTKKKQKKQTASLKIEIWSDEGKELPEGADLAEALVPHLEHVKSLCEKWFTSGDIIDDNFSGWWTIQSDG